MTNTVPGSKHAPRVDIQALRTIAVLAVVIFHAFPAVIPGGYLGVDVFFVISGYLMADLLLRTQLSTFPQAGSFWMRRVRRLMPAAITVIALTLLFILLVFPERRWVTTGKQGLGALFFSVNWQFVASSTNYLQSEEAPSPFQHFWSLSVEEQYYIALPLLFILAALIARLISRDIRVMIRVSIGIIFATSLAFSIWFTNTNPAEAYFHTFTRAWELALGGLVAAFLPWIEGWINRPGFAVRVIGYGLIFASFWVFSQSTAIPGWAALIPTVGVALLLAQTKSTPFFNRIEGTRPVQYIGDRSYSLYLVHWPILIIAAVWLPFFAQPLGIGMLLLVSLVLASLLKKYVEDPARFSPRLKSPKRLIAVSLTGVIIVSLFAGCSILFAKNQAKAAQKALTAVSNTNVYSSATCFGGMAVANTACHNALTTSGKIVPDALIASSDLPRAYNDGCWTYIPYTHFRKCTYGSGTKTVALVGNSHAGQWLEPLLKIAKVDHFKVITLLASRCAATDAHLEFYNTAYSNGCHNYGKWVLSQLKANHVDLVVTAERQSLPIAGTSSLTASAPQARAGYLTYLQKMLGVSRVLVVKDNVNPPMSRGVVPDCVEQHRSNYAACNWPLQARYWVDPQWQAANEVSNSHLYQLNLDSIMCPAGTCRAVIGGVLVYRDNSHVTNTFALSLTPVFKTSVTGALK